MKPKRDFTIVAVVIGGCGIGLACVGYTIQGLALLGEILTR